MISIYDLLCKLPSILSVTLDCHSRLPALFCFKDTCHSLQMVYYWWKSADSDLKASNDSVEIGEGSVSTIALTPPTLLDIDEKINFIQSETAKLADMSQQYLSDTVLPPMVQYKVQQGYNKIMEAMFNNDISKTYYGEYARAKAAGELKRGGDRD